MIFKASQNTAREQFWEQVCSVFEAKTTKMNFTFFYFIFWADIFGIFEINLLLVVQSKRVLLLKQYWKTLFLFYLGNDVFHDFIFFRKIIYRYCFYSITVPQVSSWRIYFLFQLSHNCSILVAFFLNCYHWFSMHSSVLRATFQRESQPKRVKNWVLFIGILGAYLYLTSAYW